MENPMQKELTQFVNEYGVSGVLEILSHVCELKGLDANDDDLKRRYNKAMLHTLWLAGKKFMRGL